MLFLLFWKNICTILINILYLHNQRIAHFAYFLDYYVSDWSTLYNNSEISIPITEGSKTVYVPVSGLNPGLYLVSLHDGNQVLETKQIFINQ